MSLAKEVNEHLDNILAIRAEIRKMDAEIKDDQTLTNKKTGETMRKQEVISYIENTIEDIKNELKDTNLYLENFERYQEITSKMEVLNSDLNTKENRWFELIKMEEDLVIN